jgi:UDP:flavonoid glycosyltransferase YjiC (YdhE family)
LSTERGTLKLLLGAFGDPGHAFPMIALGCALRDRGHTVAIETWTRWRPAIEAEGLDFVQAPEYAVFPTQESELTPYAAAVRAARDSAALIEQVEPDVVVADILTLAPALAAELVSVPWATLIPHLHPATAPGRPPFASGARLPRTPAGRWFWRALGPLSRRGLEIGRGELNDVRCELGLAPVEHTLGGISRRLCLVAAFPQLEYPRAWSAAEHVVGPMLWEPPSAPVELPDGPGPLVLVAPSTSQDPDARLVRATLEGLEGLPLRVLAVADGDTGVRCPTNATVVEWMSYAAVMPHADVVVCHGGHGTVARALSCGVPVVICPAAGDMFENAARIAWAGVGVRVPRRALRPRALRGAVSRVLDDGRMRQRAGELAAWDGARDGPRRGAELVEALAAQRR